MEQKRCYGCMKVKQNSPLCEHCGYDERTQNAPHQLPAGTILQGKYLLGKVLGQGGFGITYLGRDIALDIPVAIKEYYPTGVVTRESSYSHSVSLATGTEDTRFAENRDRFLREARTLARLEDVPEVVQVKSFFTENNTAYIVMGYVKGITLKEHMRRSGGKLSPREVFRLLEPVIAALGQVHELGLVHRDISPDNIMLQPNKRARLIDFGAAHTATLPGGTSTQAVLKHGFAPVEQYQSKGHLGSWTDVYAMCATIYHCVTGLMPPNATDRMMGEEDFRWEALFCLTEIQQTALRQGLELNYRQRIQTMEELCAKLFSGEEPAAQPAPIPKPEPVPQPEPKPQPKPAEPPVSETGTVALIRENIDNVPTVLTAPVAQPPIHTAPVQRSDSYTAPVDQEKKRGFGFGNIFAVVSVLAIIILAIIFLLPGTPPAEESSPDFSITSTQLPTDSLSVTTQPAEKQPSLESSNLSACAWNSNNGATVTITAIPSTYDETHTAAISVQLDGTEVAFVPCEWNGSAYTATVDLEAANGYGYYFIITTADGVPTCMDLNSPSNITDDTLVYMEAALGAYADLKIDGWDYQDGKLVLKSGFAQVQMPRLTSNDSDSCADTHLVLQHNGETFQYQSITLSKGDGIGHYELVLSDISLNLPELKDDDTLQLWLRGTLTNGSSIWYCGGTWTYSDGNLVPVVDQ